MVGLWLCMPIYVQDSLGGNSKTSIIANVSPSIWYDQDNLEVTMQVNY